MDCLQMLVHHRCQRLQREDLCSIGDYEMISLMSMLRGPKYNMSF